MLPSDLRLRQIGMIQNYNNEILIAGDDQNLGHNKCLNTRPAPSILKKVPSPEESDPVINTPQPESSPESTPPVIVPHTDSHTSEKTALVVFLTFTGLVILYFTKN